MGVRHELPPLPRAGRDVGVRPNLPRNVRPKVCFEAIRGGRKTNKLNYFSNFCLKYYPYLFTQEMLQNQDSYLSRLRAGEVIVLASNDSLYMTRNGKIKLRVRKEEW